MPRLIILELQFQCFIENIYDIIIANCYKDCIVKYNSDKKVIA